MPGPAESGVRPRDWKMPGWVPWSAQNGIGIRLASAGGWVAPPRCRSDDSGGEPERSGGSPIAGDRRPVDDSCKFSTAPNRVREALY
jgi:hypothetical protein